MKICSKKAITAMLAGTCIMAAAASPFIAQASEIQQQPPTTQNQKMQRHQINPEQAAERLSANFGIEKATILQYSAKGVSFKDIRRAAFLANTSGKSLDDVMSYKKPDNTWKDVATTLGITKEQMKAAHQNMMVNRLSQKTGLEKQTALDLLQQGYHPRDISIASKLATSSNKPILDVLSLKKINNRWSDVATTLGVAKETLKSSDHEMRHCFEPRGHHEKM